MLATEGVVSVSFDLSVADFGGVEVLEERNKRKCKMGANNSGKRARGITLFSLDRKRTKELGTVNQTFLAQQKFVVKLV